jgi:hypothetical protein
MEFKRSPLPLIGRASRAILDSGNLPITGAPHHLAIEVHGQPAGRSQLSTARLSSALELECSDLASEHWEAAASNPAD